MDHSRRMYQPLPSPSGAGYSPGAFAPPAHSYSNGYGNPWPRTSSSRDEDQMNVNVKAELRDQHPPKQDPPPAVDDGLHATSDFVKKLFKMLEDQTFQHIVCWGPHGDCFVVKDMNEFTKTVLPRMFKHQNFASFVRQLNKYDFHKVKNTDDNAYGEQSWTFRHPDFHADRPEALDNIKRKVPASRKASAPQPASSSRPMASATGDAEYLQGQIERLTQAQEEMSAHVRNLERNYHDVLVEMVGFQRNMSQQDGLMQNLIQYFLQSSRSQGNGNPSSSSSSTSMPPPPVLPPGGETDSNPFLPQRETLRMVHPDAASASLQQMNEMSRLSSAGYDWGSDASGASNARPPSRIWTAAANAGLINPDGTPRPGHSSSMAGSSMGGASGSASGMGEIRNRTEALQRIEELQRMRMGMASAMGINIPQPPSFPTQAQTGQQSDLEEEEEEMVMPTVTNNNTSSPESLTSPQSQASPPQHQQQHFSPQSTSGSNAGFTWPDEGMHEGLQVYTVGHLLPKEGNWGFEQPWDEGPSSSTSPGGGVTSPQQQMSVAQTAGPSSQKLRVRRSTYVPGWAVPPRVLLVDDDAVSRKLSSKFLQVFGCAIDVAVDGVGAVNKMNLEKYDLVLMDIVMPKLDGVSATSLIRKFDPMTPIISMTSNSKPNEIMTYYSSGMNDVLPKPFTKEGLLGMLEKHLSGLREMGRASTSIPRHLGAPQTESEIVSYGVAEDAGRVNPLAGMGLTDEQYNTILQNIVGTDSFAGEKRGLDDDDDGRQGKRARFELVEQ